MLVVSGLTPTKTERREGNTTEGGLWRRWRVAGGNGKFYRTRKKRKLKKKKGSRAKKKGSRAKQTLRRQRRSERGKGDLEAKRPSKEEASAKEPTKKQKHFLQARWATKL